MSNGVVRMFGPCLIKTPSTEMTIRREPFCYGGRLLRKRYAQFASDNMKCANQLDGHYFTAYMLTKLVTSNPVFLEDNPIKAIEAPH